jgi:hypothetical protein
MIHHLLLLQLYLQASQILWTLALSDLQTKILLARKGV